MRRINLKNFSQKIKSAFGTLSALACLYGLGSSFIDSGLPRPFDESAAEAAEGQLPQSYLSTTVSAYYSNRQHPERAEHLIDPTTNALESSCQSLYL